MDIVQCQASFIKHLVYIGEASPIEVIKILDHPRCLENEMDGKRLELDRRVDPGEPCWQVLLDGDEAPTLVVASAGSVVAGRSRGPKGSEEIVRHGDVTGQ